MVDRLSCSSKRNILRITSERDCCDTYIQVCATENIGVLISKGLFTM